MDKRWAHNSTLKVKVCQDCGDEFETIGHRSIRCEDCQREARLEQKREYMRNRNNARI